MRFQAIAVVFCLIAGPLGVKSAWAAETWVNEITVPVIIFREANGVRLQEETVEKVEAAALHLREFFFRNSGCRLLLKEADEESGYDYVYIDEVPVEEGELIDGNIFYKAALEERLRALGFEEGDIDSVVLYLPTPNGSGGCFVATPYLGAAGGANVYLNNNRMEYWFLFGPIHEFHHQIDNIFRRSGHREYPGCHYHANAFRWPFRSEPYPWYFGERFAGDSQIVRHWPDDDWGETGEWGSVRMLSDRDGDRVPDYWEERWGSDPDSPDGDGDGLDDLEEAMAGNVRGSNGQNPDSDGDGLDDGIDPFPLYPLDPAVPWVDEGSIEIDGQIGQDESWHCVIRGYEDPALGVSEGMDPSVYMSWSGGFLSVAVAFEKPCFLDVRLDTAGDSYCAGQDNYRIKWNANEGTGAEPEAAVYIGTLDAIEWTSYGDYDSKDEFPFERIITPGDWSAATSVQEDLYVVEARINANALTGMVPRDGAEIGVRVFFNRIEGYQERRATVFEHGEYPRVRLEPRCGLFMDGFRFSDGIFGDGLPGGGEEEDLILTLRNETGQDLEGVTATLECDVPEVAILDGEGTFGAIPDGGEVENSADPFRLRVENGFANQEVVAFRLVASEGEVALFDGMVNISVNGYADLGLQVMPFEIYSSLKPGQEGSISLTVRGNHTAEWLRNAQVELVSFDERLQVVEGACVLGTREPYDTTDFSTDSLVVSIGEILPPQDCPEVGLIGLCDGGEMWARRFTFPLTLDIYVDDDNVQGPWEGTPVHPYRYVQEGIDVALDGDTVFVAVGLYSENIDFKGKAITVRSMDPDDLGVVAATIIDGGGEGSAVTFDNGGSADSVLHGFTIRNGSSQEGGGIYCRDSSPVIRGNVITANSAGEHGGGIYCLGGDPAITGNTIEENFSWSEGGGLFCDASSPRIDANIITENSAWFHGGGIYCRGSSPEMANNIVESNTADRLGGGLFCDLSSPSMVNDTLALNACAVAGGGIYCGEDSHPEVANAILWGNAAGEGAQIYVGETGSIQVRYSDVHGGWEGTGNIDADPLFADAPAADFHLVYSSPCIDAGNLFAWVPEYDLEGDERPNGLRPDIGADEWYIRDEDGDGMDDRWESHFFGGLGQMPDGDFDEDGWSNMSEYRAKTDPTDPSEFPACYVDDDAPNDPGPCDPDVSDPLEDGSPEHPFDTIQEAVDDAGDWYAVLVEEGAYYENVSIIDKAVRLSSLDPRDPERVAATIIDGGGEGFCVLFSFAGETGCALAGFTIRNGSSREGAGVYLRCCSPTIMNNVITSNSAENFGGGILLNESSSTIISNTIVYNDALSGAGIMCAESSPALTNNIIVGNEAQESGGGICCLYDSSLEVINCTIAHNLANQNFGGIYCGEYCSLDLKNSILWENDGPQIHVEPTSPIEVTYSDVEGGWEGEGNIDEDPLFCDGPDGGYYLQQIAAGQTEDSPCVNAGDPNSEPIDGTTRTDGLPDGDIVDMGYHYPGCPGAIGDIDDDGRITTSDSRLCYQIVEGIYEPTLCEEWRADADGDGTVTTHDALCIFHEALGMPNECFENQKRAQTFTLNTSWEAEAARGR